MRLIITTLAALLSTAAAAVTVPPSTVDITAAPTVTIKVTPRSGNTSTTIPVTVNKQDTVRRCAPATASAPAACAQVYPVLPPKPVVPDVTAWVRVAIENESFTMPVERMVRYGDGVTWTQKLGTTGTCSVAWFGVDPKPSVYKICEMQIKVPGVVQTGGAPVINMALVPPPAKSKPGPRVRQLSPAELANSVFQPSPSAHGAVRFVCGFSHMNMDDPIVAPGVKNGSMHMHTWEGNMLGDYSSTPTSLLTTGDSTCAGGSLNRTAYWFPTLVDIRTGQPLVPISTNFYYKDGVFDVNPAAIQSFPPGLRMIAGNSKNAAPVSGVFAIGLECVSGGGHKPAIPSCAVGDELNTSVIFPQCWDGRNVDSPDHKSHMAYAVAGKGCPITHPVALPEIALNVHYKISEPNSAAFLRLSSDMYAATESGYSMHADWFGGWDAATNDAWRKNCINAFMDCHNHLLGDGRMLY